MSTISVRRRIRQYKWHPVVVPFEKLDAARNWCYDTLIINDWTYGLCNGKFAFKNQEDALMFSMKWL